MTACVWTAKPPAGNSHLGSFLPETQSSQHSLTCPVPSLKLSSDSAGVLKGTMTHRAPFAGKQPPLPWQPQQGQRHPPRHSTGMNELACNTGGFSRVQDACQGAEADGKEETPARPPKTGCWPTAGAGWLASGCTAGPKQSPSLQGLHSEDRPPGGQERRDTAQEDRSRADHLSSKNGLAEDSAEGRRPFPPTSPCPRRSATLVPKEHGQPSPRMLHTGG